MVTKTNMPWIISDNSFNMNIIMKSHGQGLN